MTDLHADLRGQALKSWLHSIASVFSIDIDSLQPASADASFRRYFRLTSTSHGSLIVMDAPPERENCGPFIQIAELMANAGLNVPKVLAQNLEQGFLLLTDLGRDTYLKHLDPAKPEQATPMFLDAIDALIRWQLASRPEVLPPYNEAMLRRELNLFPDWYVSKHLGLTLTSAQRNVLDTAFNHIIAVNLAEPQVYVHRDYMPRNLMISNPRPGVLDFQDAVYGPLSYDVASLFKDAFISWDEEVVLDWTIRYWERARKAGLPVDSDFGEFYRHFEWMSLQRHLKVLGIFARINYRDGKPHYLTDTPRFIRYVRTTTNRYNSLRPLMRLIDELEGVVVESGYTF